MSDKTYAFNCEKNKDHLPALLDDAEETMDRLASVGCWHDDKAPERPITIQQCNCRTANEAHLGHKIKGGEEPFAMVPTISNDGQTCAFCGYYVVLAPPPVTQQAVAKSRAHNNGRRKITLQLASAIRAEHQAGARPRQLMAKYKLAESTVSNILNNKIAV